MTIATIVIGLSLLDDVTCSKTCLRKGVY